MKIKLMCFTAVLMLSQFALADCPSSKERFVAQDDQVTDKQTGLIWDRCSAGHKWDGGSCSGAATPLNYQQAEDLAAKSNGWRLPDAKELLSIVDPGCRNPSIDSMVFPNTPERWFWTSEVFPWSGNSSVWVVLFTNGNFDGFAKRWDHLAVRLVRASDGLHVPSAVGQK